MPGEQKKQPEPQGSGADVQVPPEPSDDGGPREVHIQEFQPSPLDKIKERYGTGENFLILGEGTFSNTKLDKLYEAMSKAQGEFGVVEKDNENPFYHSRYADTASILRAVRQPLSNNGLCIIQLPSVVNANDGTVLVHTILGHKSGQNIHCSVKGHAGYRKENSREWTPSKDPQKMGSVITYLRRYSIMCILCLAPADDDDGEGKQSSNNKQGSEGSSKASNKSSAGNKQDSASASSDSSALPSKEQLEVEHNRIFDYLLYLSDGDEKKFAQILLKQTKKLHNNLTGMPPKHMHHLFLKLETQIDAFERNGGTKEGRAA